jgi:hypothetical protein
VRDYGKVHTKFWSSETTRGLTDDGRMLALYLITSPHSTIAGAFHLPDGYVCEDMQWTLERVAEAFAELLQQGFANRCETTKWVWITKHLEWNPPENPNQRKSAAKVAHGVPVKTCWKLEFMRVCGPSLGIEAAPISNPSPTVAKPFPNQEPEQEPEQEQKQEEGKTRKRAPLVSRPDDVTEQTWTDWTNLRKSKRAPVSETVLEQARKESEKAGIPLERFLTIWCLRGSQGLEAAWLRSDERKNFTDRQSETVRALTGGMANPGGTHAALTYDVD